MKELDLKLFKGLKPCEDGYEFVLELKTTDLKVIFEKLKEHNADWANWLLVRLLSNKNKVQYAIYAAEQVIHIFEARYPTDNRPRQEIDFAKAHVLSAETVLAAARAAARDAARAAVLDAARAAARETDRAARAVAGAAWAAVGAARAAWVAAWEAAGAARDAAGAAAGDEVNSKILDYGLKLLEEQND